MNDIKIVEYDEFANQLDHLAEVANFVADVSDKDGYDKCKEIQRKFRKLENSVEKIRKDKKAYWMEGSKQVDSQAKAIMNQIADLRLPHTEAYQTLDAEKKERERLRTEKLNERVEYIRTLPELLADSCSDEILPAMESMQTEECLDFYEFTELALKARNATRDALGKLYASKLKSEQEAEELERLRAESAKREQEDREERIRKDATEKAEQAAENARLAEVKRQSDIVEAERVETAKREANTKNIGIVRKAAKEALMLCGIDEATAKKIVLAIHSKKIPNVSIKY